MVSRIQSLTPNRIPLQWWGWGILVGLGWLFRLRTYWFNRSLWLDEANLANNVIRFSLQDLITKPLLSDQAAPVGFLMVTKVLISRISESEKVLRLLPLSAGMAVVLLALWLSYQVFEKTSSRLTFVSLVVFSPILIFYSTEFKQYILDISFGLLILGFGIYIDRLQTGLVKNATTGRLRLAIAILGMIGCVGIWFSHPSVFFLFGVGVSLFWQALRERRKADLVELAVIGISWISSFALSFWLTLRNVADNQSLLSFWSAGFAPNPLGGWTALRWYLDTGLGAVFLAFQENTIPSPSFRPEWYHLFNLVLGIACLGGCIWITMRRKLLGFMLTLTGLAAWAASMMGYYSLRGRLFLFIVPIIYLLVAGLSEALDQNKLKCLSWLITISLMGMVIFPSAKVFVKPFAFSEIRSVLKYLTEESLPDEDLVAISEWSVPAYVYYGSRFKLRHLDQGFLIDIKNDAQEFLEVVCDHPDRGRIWLVFSHRMSETRELLATMRALTPQLDQSESQGAGVYLFDFSAPGVCQEP